MGVQSRVKLNKLGKLMERKALLTIVVCGLVAILFLMITGCSTYTTKPKISLSDDDYILLCEYRGGSKECGYVEQRAIQRELDFLRNNARY
tara:strand:+ start:11352 stop:11624 length:273 start_codon:yes stop_codon:yes gene_type:complete